MLLLYHTDIYFHTYLRFCFVWLPLSLLFSSSFFFLLPVFRLFFLFFSCSLFAVLWDCKQHSEPRRRKHELFYWVKHVIPWCPFCPRLIGCHSCFHHCFHLQKRKVALTHVTPCPFTHISSEWMNLNMQFLHSFALQGHACLTWSFSLFQPGACYPTSLQSIKWILPTADPRCLLHPPHMSLNKRSRNLLLHTRELLWEEEERYEVNVSNLSHVLLQNRIVLKWSDIDTSQKRDWQCFLDAEDFNSTSVFVVRLAIGLHCTVCRSISCLGILSNRFLSPRADLAAAEATRGSTTEARKATVLMTGFPAWLKGIGW